MALTPFIPTANSTHLTFRNNYNANMAESESRLASMESNTGDYSLSGHKHLVADISGLGTMATQSSGDYSPTGHTHTEYSPTGHTHTEYASTSHTHTVTDIDSAAAPSGYVITADGIGNATWEEAQGGGGNFSVVKVKNVTTYTQIPQHTHFIYAGNDFFVDPPAQSGSGSGSGVGSEPCLIVDLLDPTLHEGVTVHKLVEEGVELCSALLLPPSGCTLDGVVSDGLVSGYTLEVNNESISIFSDGVSGYYIQ